MKSEINLQQNLCLICLLTLYVNCQHNILPTIPEHYKSCVLNLNSEWSEPPSCDNGTIFLCNHTAIMLC